MLTTLRKSGLRLGIVTNGRQDMQTAKIDSMKLESVVNCIVISGAVGVKKPDPRIYEIALASVGTIAAETLFVGDHPELDVRAPREAGMRTVWLDTGTAWPREICRADHEIKSLEELIRIVSA
jgi:putative hydrolase of the HAD superfamily